MGPYNVSTVAGTGDASAALGDGGLATAAGLNYPIGVTWHKGSLYIADTQHHRIRRLDTASGAISTIAGIGVKLYGGDGAAASLASLNMPTSISFSAAGDAFISDTSNNRVRRMDQQSNIMTTHAGDGKATYAGDGGQATTASMYLPMKSVFTPDGSLFVADFYNHAVRLVHPETGIISTVAGSGEAGFSGDGEPATEATLSFPAGLALDAQGRLLIADMNNHVIRRVTFVNGSADAGTIETVADTPDSEGFSGDGQEATSAQLSSPADVAVDTAGNILIVDSDNHRVRRVDAATGIITTIAGSGQEGSSGDGGAALAAAFSAPQGVAVGPNGDIYVADTMSQRVRLLRCA